MTSESLISRRRFLATVGATGITAAAGLGGWRLLTGKESSAATAPISVISQEQAEPDLVIVEVEPRFVDATVWDGQLFTLRTGADGTDIVVRAETTGEDYAVEASLNFEARCIGAINDTMIIGGHQTAIAGHLAYEPGPSYPELISLGGADAQPLLNEPVQPTPERYEHQLLTYVPTVMKAREVSDWTLADLRVDQPLAGSCGAILEDSGTIAIDHYLDAETPDSIFEVLLVDGTGRLGDTPSNPQVGLHVDHGHIWGTAFDGTQDLLIVTDRTGTRGVTKSAEALFELDPSFVLLAVNASDEALSLAVESSDRGREVWEFCNQEYHQSTRVGQGTTTLHRVSRDLVIASASGKTNTKNTSSATSPLDS